MNKKPTHLSYKTDATLKKILPLLLLLFVIVLVAYLFNIQSSTPSYDPGKLPFLAKDTAPWPPEITHLKERLSTVGLPALTVEGLTYHIHQHIDIYINGQKREIPGGIGIGPNEGYISSIHTHDTTGFIHIESPEIKDFSLGQFFDIWGVVFNDNCIGGYCTQDNKKLRLYNNGKEVAGTFRALKLTPHQEIVVFYGIDSELPQPIPSRFDFPADY